MQNLVKIDASNNSMNKTTSKKDIGTNLEDEEEYGRKFSRLTDPNKLKTILENESEAFEDSKNDISLFTKINNKSSPKNPNSVILATRNGYELSLTPTPSINQNENIIKNEDITHIASATELGKKYKNDSKLNKSNNIEGKIQK